MRNAYYYGRRVLVLATRHVAGGAASDIRRHPEETDWPWSVSEFTTNAELLTAQAPS